MSFTFSCTSAGRSNNQGQTNDSLVPEKNVQLSDNEKANLNSYFTAFSEIHLPVFTQNNLPDSVLIQFGVYYNYRKHFKMFKQIAVGSKASIGEVQVAGTAFHFFGVAIKKHQPSEGIVYSKNNYIIANSDGEAYRFSQIRSLSDAGNGVFNANIEIFSASSGFTGDINASPETWISASAGEDAPISEGKMKAKIRKIEEKGTIRYVLLEYVNI